MKKFRLYFDKDKETEWLNDMAAQGYALTSFFAGIYTFDTCAPNKYTYQVDFCDKLGNVSEDYREFMRENQIEIVQIWGFWIFLRKLNVDGPFELYSDIDSSIEHYTKIRNMFKCASIIMILCFMIECFAVIQAPLCFPLLILLGAMTFSILHTTFKTNLIIAELKEQKGEPIKNPHRVSPALIFGLLLNSIALVSSSLPDNIEYPLRIVALACLIYGIIKSSSQK